jgi:hypothetical protein
VINVIGQLLPFMVAMALSTLPILVTVTILLTPSSGRSALAFLIGWLLGLFLLTGLLAVVLNAIPRVTSRRNQQTIGWIEIVLGLSLLGYCVVMMVRGRDAETRTELPKWVRKVGTLKPIASFGLAVALNVRPKSLLIATSAGVILGAASLGLSESILVLLVFVVVSGSTVTVPIVLALANPTSMRRPLEATSQWIVRNGRTVTIVVALIIGTVVIGDGMTRL